MKRIFLFAAMAAAITAVGQKKPKILAAETAVANGNNAEALAITDQGIVHEKTMNDPKTWFVRGLALANLDTAGQPGGDIKAAMAAFDKADQLKKGSSENFLLSGATMVTQPQAKYAYWAHYINKGVAAFQNEDPASAVKYFEATTIVYPDTLDGYYYAGLASESIKDFDNALKNYKTYAEKGGPEVDAYERTLYILSQEKKDNEAALAFVKESKKKFPNTKSISDWEFRILFALDRVDEAILSLENAVKEEPNNAELWFNLGVMNEQVGKLEDAEENYRTAAKIDPTYFNAFFNLGVMYRNKLVEKSKEKNNLGISKEDQAKGRKLDAEIVELSKEALPYWEKCRELNGNDQTTLETLQYIYVQIKDYDKAEEVMNKLEELGFK